MHFDAATGKVKCDYCDSTFTIEEVKKSYEEKNQKAREAAKEAAGDTAGLGAEELGIEAPNVETAAGEDWGSDASKLKVYNCGNCGAQLITDETTAATTCPYCGNPTIIPGQFSAGRKPDYVIPFACEKEQAMEKLQSYYKGKKLLPKSFTSGNHLEEIKGVYVPYWLFSGSVDADMTFECGKSTTTREGDFDVTRTKLYRVRRAGTMKFEKIPCDASTSMPDDLMDSVEPYHYDSLRKFELEYLPGYLANKYDVEQKTLQKKADERAVATACDELRDSISGYDSVTEQGRSAKIRRKSAQYILYTLQLLLCALRLHHAGGQFQRCVRLCPCILNIRNNLIRRLIDIHSNSVLSVRNGKSAIFTDQSVIDRLLVHILCICLKKAFYLLFIGGICDVEHEIFMLQILLGFVTFDQITGSADT